MENINDSDNENLVSLDGQKGQSNETWYAFSILSWFLLLCAEFDTYTYEYPFKSANNIVNTFIGKVEEIEIIHFLFLHCPMITSKIFILCFTLFGFIIYLIFTTYKKDENLFKSMISILTRFHFISFLLIIIAFTFSQNLTSEIFNNKNPLIISLAFSFLGFASLVFIYFKTNLPCEWYIVFSIKKGCFSSLITYSWFLIFYNIIKLCLTGSNFINGKLYNFDIVNYLKVFKIAINVCISINGLGCLIYSLIFTDIVMLFTNVLIYIDLMIFVFSKFKFSVDNLLIDSIDKVRDYIDKNKNSYIEIEQSIKEIRISFGTVSSILMALFVAEMIFIIIRFKQKLFK